VAVPPQEASLPSKVLAVKSSTVRADALLEHLRQWTTPIVARVEGRSGAARLRTVEPEQDATLIAAMGASAKPILVR